MGHSLIFPLLMLSYNLQAEKINTILKAANVTVEPYWPGMFAKASAGLDLKAIVSNVGAGVGTGGAPAAAAAGGGGAAAAAGNITSNLSVG